MWAPKGKWGAIKAYWAPKRHMGCHKDKWGAIKAYGAPKGMWGTEDLVSLAWDEE